jgi:hypothetical protein
VVGVSGFRVTKLWAYLQIDDDDEEGLPAFGYGVIVLPMLATDERRVEALRPMAAEAAAHTGRPVRLVVFEGMRELEVLAPPPPPAGGNGQRQRQADG